MLVDAWHREPAATCEDPASAGLSCPRGADTGLSFVMQVRPGSFSHAG
jgi:hypothetical protein